MKNKNYQNSYSGIVNRTGVRIVAIILLMLFQSVNCSDLLSQEKTFSIELKNATLLKALTEANRLNGNEILFKIEEVQKETRLISLSLHSTTTINFVKQVIQGMNYTTATSNGKVIVVPAKRQGNPIKVNGMVTDLNGNPLPGATIVVKGLPKVGISTDLDGNFQFEFPEGTKTLVASFVGFKNKEIAITGNNMTLRISLDEESISVNEVVVTGLFTRKASSYTGSTVTLSKRDLQRVGNQNVLQSLKNLEPSMLVIDNLTMGSDPNSVPEMQLRGTSTFTTEEVGLNLKGNYQNKPNQPLFILDGFEASITKIFDLDMNRVESVTILKDAAAKAIYGSKAANGVVVIETRKLGGNQQLIAYSGGLDITMPDLSSYNLCNALEKLEAERIEGVYSNATYTIDKLKLEQLYYQRLKLAKEGLNTYWLAKPLRVGISHKHNVSIEMGDNKNLRAVADITYKNDEGIMIGSGRNVFSGDVDLSYRHKNFLFKNIVSLSSVHSNSSPYGDFSDYAKMNPFWKAVDTETGLIPRYAEGNNITNPLYNSTLNTKLTESYLEVTNNFYAEWFINDAWKLTARAGINAKRSDADEFYPSNHTKFENLKNSAEDRLKRGSYRVDNGKSSSLDGSIYANYNKTIGKNSLFANIGAYINESSYRAIYHQAIGFPSDKMNDIIFARSYAVDSRPVGTSSLVRELSFLGVLSYTYDDRFLAEATVREGASSQFGAEKRWATMWSTGIGWNMHKESFLNSLPYIKQMKLRASMGVTGNQNFTTNESVATYMYYTDLSYQDMTGSYLANMANPYLQWEQKMDYNVGFDSQIGDLTLRFDYYNSLTKNLLTDISTAPSTGFNTVKDNLGKVRNTGIEINASYTLLKSKEGFLNLSASLATNHNEIVELSEGMKTYNALQMSLAADMSRSTPVLMYQDGMPMDAIWAVPSLGIDPMNGQEIYRKQNGDLTYVYDPTDLVMAGTTTPKYRGNFGFNGEYKGFGLSVVFRYLGGCEMYNSTLVSKVENIDIDYNVDKRVLSGRWQTPGQHAQYKILGHYTNGDDPTSRQEETRATTRFVQKRDELDIASVTAYYDFSPVLLTKMGVKRLKFSAYMNEISKFSTIRIERGTSYPFARTLSFSLTATF